MTTRYAIYDRYDAVAAGHILPSGECREYVRADDYDRDVGELATKLRWACRRVANHSRTGKISEEAAAILKWLDTQYPKEDPHA